MPWRQYSAHPEFHHGRYEVLEAGDFPGRCLNLGKGTSWYGPARLPPRHAEPFRAPAAGAGLICTRCRGTPVRRVR